MHRVLFVCGRNRLRSPTAEQLFASAAGLEVRSAGLDADAEEVLGPELVAWAQTIFVMEATHRRKLQQRFRRQLKGQRIVCLDIPDRYAYLDPELVQLLEKRVTPLLARTARPAQRRPQRALAD
jgi:predicted protein tyrosine phosphatase